MSQGKGAGAAPQSRPSQQEVSVLGGLFNQGRYAEMEIPARSLTVRYPGHGIGWKALGMSLMRQGRNAEALEPLQKAAKLLPGDFDTHYDLGLVIQEQGRPAEAEACFRRTLELKPDFAEAHNNLGILLGMQGRFPEAEASFRRALKIWPGFAEAHNNLGIVLERQGSLAEAEASYRRALEINPDYVEAHDNQSVILLKIKPEYTEAQSNQLFTLNSTFGHSPEYCLEQARQFGRMVASKANKRFSSWPLCATPPKRLRVGVVSGDLNNHPVGYFLESILAHLDPTRLELVAYPTHLKSDELTQRIKPYFAEWKPLSGLDDEAAAWLIHADGVHVLLDLSGHTAHNRLPIFAWKPAPVQVSWLGYFATTGMAEMDYLLADEVGLPDASSREQYTETIKYLPDTRLCFTAPEVGVPVAALPALANGHITFGCFQNLFKVGDAVLTAWGKILAALPGARLRMQCKQLDTPLLQEQWGQRLRRCGIDPARVKMLGAVPRATYLAAHNEVDMILDTFPYPGGTTTCEALWMGVPTLTLAGGSLLARQGASLLSAAGLKDWVAGDEAEYVAKAISLAGDIAMLSGLRAGLRQQVLASPLFDAPRFARNLEAALWEMWEDFQSRQKT